MSSDSSTHAADCRTSTTLRFSRGSYPAVNIPGFAYFGREPYSYIQRTEQRYQFTDNFSWTLGRHNTKFGVDVNYLPLTAIFTVNYGGVYDFEVYNSLCPRRCGKQSLFGPCNPTALAFPAISFRVLAAPAILSKTLPLVLSGRTHGASVLT